MFWYNYFMDDVFAHLVFYILFKKIGEMIDSVVLISQGPILFFATAESNRQCCSVARLFNLTADDNLAPN
jgi:hypothetical protein